MPTVYRIAIRTTRSENRGRFKVTLFAREGTYALSVPQSVFGKFMYQLAKKKPIIIDFGRRNAVSVDVNFKGIRPLGKTARGLLTYTPLKPSKGEKKEKKNVTTTAPAKETATPKIEEVTSALASALPAEPKRSRRKKKAAATAA